jgi:hypothetical protein
MATHSLFPDAIVKQQLRIIILDENRKEFDVLEIPKCALGILRGHVNLLKVSCKPFQHQGALIQQFLIMIP